MPFWGACRNLCENGLIVGRFAWSYAIVRSVQEKWSAFVCQHIHKEEGKKDRSPAEEETLQKVGTIDFCFSVGMCKFSNGKLVNLS